MKTTTITKLIAFVKYNTTTLKLWYADTRTFKNRIVDIDDDAWIDELKDREHTYHVALEDSGDFDDFTAEFKNFEAAYKMFKNIVVEKGFSHVFICDDFDDYNPYKAWDDVPMTQEEEYEEACMAEAYGQPLLMQRYNRKYGIEKEYSPSNPWDAPGMKVSDFI